METITDSLELAVPVDRLFAYYADPAGAVRMSHPDMHLRLLRADTPLRENSRVVFSLRPQMLPFEVQWQFVIVEFRLNESFTEVSESGPFSVWRHQHRFESLGPDRSRVTDTISFGPPTGFAAFVLGMAKVRSMLEKSFRHREQRLRADLENKR